MKKLLYTILVILLPLLQLQAQHDEPQLKMCEDLIRKVQQATNRTQKAEALCRLGQYCRSRGLFDEGALVTSHSLQFFADARSPITSTGPMGFGETLVASFQTPRMPRGNKLKQVNATILVADNMAHSTTLHIKAKSVFKTGILELYNMERDLDYTRGKTLQADFYLQQQDYSQAERAYKKCIKRAIKCSYKADEIMPLMNKLAITYIAQKKYDKAKELLEGIPLKDSSTKPTIGFEDVLCSRACIAIVEKEYTKANDLTKQAYNRYLTTLKPGKFYSPALRNFLNSFIQIARCYEYRKQRTKAMETYSLMRQCLIATYGTFLPYYIDEDRMNLNHMLQPWYEEMQTFAIRYPKLYNMPVFLYNNAQFMKQFFLGSPSIYTTKMSAMQADPYLHQVRHRMEKWLLTEEAQNVYLKGDYLPAIYANVRGNALSRDAINYVFSKVNEFYDCRTDWKDVQKKMGTNEVMIEFISIRQPSKGKCQYAALVFKKEDQTPHYIPLCQEDKLQKALNNPNSRNAFLLKSIWKPLEKHFNNKSLLTILPTGLLNTVSFAGIRDKKGVYLCQKYQLAYQLSATDRLRMTYTGTPENKTAILFGGADYGLPPSRLADQVRGQGFHYLPQSKIEVSSIAQILKEKGCSINMYTGKEATEKSFKNLSNLDCSPYILHISTHGFYLPYQPGLTSKGLNNEGQSGYYYPFLRTGIVFSGANQSWKDAATLNLPNDGISTAYEITGMALMNTELVVLSACNTGLGDIRDGEGVYGLQRAFRSAGARSMIMSLSEVPDKETAEFMTLFYQNWKKDTPKSTAFRKAQVYMSKKYPASPEKWAGFILME